MTKEIEIRLVVPANSMRWLLTAALMLACVSDTVSESVSLTTYYPAPSGIYTQMITTNNTWIARDGGNAIFGTGAASGKVAIYGGALTVNGSNNVQVNGGNLQMNAGGDIAMSAGSQLQMGGAAINGTFGIVPTGYATWNSYGTGAGGAAIYNDGPDTATYKKLMIVGNDSEGGPGGPRNVGVWDNLAVNGSVSVAGGGAGSRGYIYINNGATACTATTAPVDTTICAAGQYATFTPGIYTEGYTYSNRGGQVLAVKGGYNTTQVLGLNPGVQMGGYPKDVDWLTLNKDDQGVTYYCCLK